MKNSTHRTNIFAYHTGNIARRVHRNRIKIADEIYGLRAHRHTRTAMNTGIPANVKDNRFVFHNDLLMC